MRTLKTIQRMREKFFGACEDQSKGWERVKGNERVRDPRTVRFEELNAGESGGSECFGEREWRLEELEKD